MSRTPGLGIAIPLACLLAAKAAAAPELPVPDAATEVRVERVKPMRDKHPTLRFLRENRDWIRSRFDRLREKPIARGSQATAIDPRFLTYERLLAELAAGRDSMAMAEEARSRRELFASVAELSVLEDQLDQLERQLAFQRARLDTLEDHFLSDQRTELLVVLSGFPRGGTLPRVVLELEDGVITTLPLDDARQRSLGQGGMLEIFHGFVEPRAQVLRVELGDGALATGYLTLDPVRDRLNLLRLDLSGMSVEGGAAEVRASTWVHASRAVAAGD